MLLTMRNVTANSLTLFKLLRLAAFFFTAELHASVVTLLRLIFMSNNDIFLQIIIKHGNKIRHIYRMRFDVLFNPILSFVRFNEFHIIIFH